MKVGVFCPSQNFVKAPASINILVKKKLQIQYILSKKNVQVCVKCFLIFKHLSLDGFEKDRNIKKTPTNNPQVNLGANHFDFKC